MFNVVELFRKNLYLYNKQLAWVLVKKEKILKVYLVVYEFVFEVLLYDICTALPNI